MHCILLEQIDHFLLKIHLDLFERMLLLFLPTVLPRHLAIRGAALDHHHVATARVVTLVNLLNNLCILSC
jgi:hypothetical protein